MASPTTNLKTKSALIYDYGLFSSLASRLSRDFGKVYYYCHWESSLPKSNLALIGSGFDGVERVQDFFDYIDRVDLIVFPDTYTDDLVEHLRRKGYRVWGAGKAEMLENNRWKTRKIQKEIGLPTQKTTRIIGIDNLIEYLKKEKDKFVKIDIYRGDTESFYHSTYDETEAQFLGKLMHDVGAKGKTMEFVVEDKVGEVEPGYDGWVIDGQYPSIGLYGYEKKDEGYIGKVSKYELMPQAIKEVNEKLKSVLKKLGGRTFFSTELRIDKNKRPYLIDPTVRMPFPPFGVHLEMWKNLAEIIWFGAEGKLVEPIPAAKYGAELILQSEWAKDNWLYIDIPKEIRQWVKLKEAFVTNGKSYALPGTSQIGTVVGLGNTLEEAVNKAKEYAAKVKGKEVTYSSTALDGLVKETIPRGKQLGIQF